MLQRICHSSHPIWSRGPDRMALLCVTRHVTSGESAHHLRCVLPYYAVRDIRHGVRCPGNDVNRFMCVPGQISLSRFSISPLFEQPGQKHPRKITNRDNEIWPGSHVNRLPSPPGHRLRIDKMLQCLTGMRPYRDSNVSLEVEESSSTPPNRKHGGNPAMLRITAPRAWCGGSRLRAAWM